MKSVFYVAPGIILAALGFSYGLSFPYYIGHAIGWAGVVISIGAAYLQYRDTLPHEYFFSENEWQSTQDGFSLSIPLKTHKKNAGASVVILGKNPDGYEQVICDNHVLNDGSVLVHAFVRFDGKVIVK
jgi:hypothetical protein